MRPHSLAYIVRESVKGLLKNSLMSLASIGTVVLALTLLGSFILTAVNLDSIAREVESQIEIVAYLDKESAGESLAGEVLSMGGVVSVQYVDPDTALQRLKERFGDQADLLAGVEHINPLRPSLEIRTTSPSMVEKVAGDLAEMPGVQEVVYYRNVIEKLLKVTGLIRSGGMIVAALLALATVVIIHNTIRLTVHARRREIAIMKVVGASDFLVRWPFVLEGILIGLIGAGITAAIIWPGYDYVILTLGETIPFVPLVGRDEVLPSLLKLLFGLGAAIGGIGSYLSVRRYLRT